MTYRQLELLYCQTDWSDPESVKRYNDAAREYREQKGESENERV